jgi:hypothetical protein
MPVPSVGLINEFWEKELNTIAIEEKELYTMTPYLKYQIPYLPRYYGELIVATVSSPPLLLSL